MDTPLRNVELNCGHTLAIWDAYSRAPTGQHQIRYTMVTPAGDVLFCGADCGVSPMHAIDSDAALLALLGFLTLRKGDTDAEYFAEYTEAQLEWAASSACESLACDVAVAEEAGGCACGYVWRNRDGWECSDEDRGNVVAWEVLDHGEDGSQYFPGCGVASSRGPDGLPFQHVVTGVGDTAAEALDDALESMAQNDHTVSPIVEREMRNYLPAVEKSAHASFAGHSCGLDEPCECDWHHYVSVRYNVRKEGE